LPAKNIKVRFSLILVCRQGASNVLACQKYKSTFFSYFGMQARSKQRTCLPKTTQKVSLSVFRKGQASPAVVEKLGSEM